MKGLYRKDKNLKLVVLFLITSFLYIGAKAQGSPVGGNLGFGSETSPAIAFDTAANVPYIAYGDGAINSFVVQKFENNTWTQVGSNLGFASQSSPAIAFNPATNEPYIAYADGATHNFIIQRFTNGAWTQVGSNQAFTSNGIPSLAFNPATNEPYLAVLNDAIGLFMVRKFSEGSWVSVGSFLGSGSATSPSLAFNPVTQEPYVAIEDNVNNSFVVVKFSNGSWTPVGQEQGFASHAAASLKFAKGSTIPYLMYPDGSSHSIVVKKFVDNQWIQVGDNRGFVSGGGMPGTQPVPPSIIFNNATGEPYIAYVDAAVHKYIVEKFTNDKWEQVGSFGFGSFSAPSLIFNPSGTDLFTAYLDEASHTFQVQQTSTGVALPVTFTSVNAVIRNIAAQISWKVAGEQGIKGYEVERSIDGYTFTKIHTLASKPNSTNAVTYVWDDKTPLPGTNYYRIKSIDISGKSSYTSTVKLVFNPFNRSFAVSPNPVIGSYFNVSFNNQPPGNYTIKLINVAGQIVYSQKTIHNGGSKIQRINIPQRVGNGIFSMEITKEGYKDIRSLIISNK